MSVSQGTVMADSPSRSATSGAKTTIMMESFRATCDSVKYGSQLCKGDPYFTLSQVALNDSIMIVVFAPLVALLLGLSAITVPWDTLIASVGLYIIVPVLLAQMIRRSLLAKGHAHFQRLVAKLGPYSISALLATLVLLFAFQGEAIVREPLVIAMLAVPILIQVFFN